MRALYFLTALPVLAACSSGPSPGVDEFISACDAMHDLDLVMENPSDLMAVPEIREAVDALRDAPEVDDADMAVDIEILVETAYGTELMPAFRDGVMRQSCIESFPQRYG